VAWKLSILDDQGNRTVVNLVRDDYSIGRAETNSVRLTERNISRQHASLLRRNNHWVIQDLASYNGVFVNGLRVSEGQELTGQDLVQIGDYRLEFADTEPTTDESAPLPAFGSTAESIIDRDRLVVVVGPEPGAEFALSDTLMVLGRGEECDVILNHASVSRVHAEIQSLGDGRYEILDRESANGVRVNGVELQRSLLDARDMIELGEVVLKFIPAGQMYRPTREESQARPALAMTSENAAAAVDVSLPKSKRLPLPAKLAAVVAGLGLLAALVILLLSSGSGTSDDDAKRASGAADGATRVLAEARALMEGGDVEAAHQKLATGIPPDSNARKSQDFIEIESKWADMLFSRAARERDPAAKRALLEKVSSSSSVDSLRRKRALNEIAQLTGEPVDITDLPNAPAALARREQAAAPGPRASPRTNQPAAAQEAKAPAASAGPSTAGATLVRENPFDQPSSGTKDLATSGDRASQTRAKTLLQSKVRQGTATDQDKRMLRALCRQLGDASCSN
jgi:pSer/pThr/pTyr-binding forkhead associated (FHA) protein